MKKVVILSLLLVFLFTLNAFSLDDKLRLVDDADLFSAGEEQRLNQKLSEKSEEYGAPIYLLADEPYRELVYDDGVEVHDVRLAQIFDKYGMKCTFNFNCAYMRERNFSNEEIKEHYNIVVGLKTAPLRNHI